MGEGVAAAGAAGAPAPEVAAASGAVSIHVIWSVAVIGTVIFAFGAALLFIWLRRRRAHRRTLPDLTGEGVIHGITTGCQDEASPKKLQKGAWSMSQSRVVSTASTSSVSSGDSGYTLLARRHMSLPVPILRRWSRGFGSRLSLLSGIGGISKRDSSGGQKPRHGHRRNPSWIDEDALHGPATSVTALGEGGGKRKEGRRDSWYMLNRSPTLPMLRRSQCGGGFEAHWEEFIGKDMMTMSMSGANGLYPSSPDSYTQVVMEARSLPEPPKPAVVAGRDRQLSMVVPPTSSAGGAARLGHKYSNSEPPMRPTTGINTSPVRSLPRTPTRARVRQSSTDSTLSEILRSTEKRLQEGYVSTARLPRRSRTTAAALGRSQWYGTSRESLLDGSQCGVIEPLGGTIHRSRSESKPSGQKKVTISADFVGGHSRQESHTSTISSTSSIELTAINDFANSGMVDYREPETEMQMLGFQSVRSSVSSALSTIQSEDEALESVKMASSPLSSPNASSRFERRDGRGSVATSHKSTSAGDPFSNMPTSPVPAAIPRPLTTYGNPTKSQKSPDLLRESLERSLRSSLLRAPVDQSTLLAEASRLPPLPAAPGGEKPHSFFRSDCSGCCKLGQTKTSVLNSIVLPPPQAAPQFAGINGNVRSDNSSPPPSPTHRPSSRASASKLHRWSSVSSSVYSQDPKELSAPPPAILPMSSSLNANKTSFQANSHLSLPVPIPAPLQTVFKGARNSADNTKMPKFTGFIAAKKEGKRVLSLDDSENDQENIDISGHHLSPSSTECAITSTVVELRRMNSALSMATSVASNDAPDSRPNTPTATRLSTMSGKNGHRKSKSGSSDTASARKAYLSLGGTTTNSASSSPASSPQKVRSLSTTVASRSGSPALRSRGRRESVIVPSFVAALESATTSPAATSSGSPTKKKRRTVAGTTARSSPSPGVLLGRKVSEEQHDKYRFEEDGQAEKKQSNNSNDKTTNSKQNTPRSLSIQTVGITHANLTAQTQSKYAPAPVSAVASTFEFPPVSASSFTFQVIPASSPASSPSQSNPSTPIQQQHLNTSPSPSNRNGNGHSHRRQNSSTDFRLQWGQPLVVAKHREQTRTPSPQKGTFELSSFAYSPGQSPPTTLTQAPLTPMSSMAMSPEVEGNMKRNSLVIEPLNLRNSQQSLQAQTKDQNLNLQIPLKSPRRREKLQQQREQQRVLFEKQEQQQKQPVSSFASNSGELTGVGEGSGVGMSTGNDLAPRITNGNGNTTQQAHAHAQGRTTKTPTKTTTTAGMAQGQTPGTVGTAGRRSIESLGLYDKDGFYISNSPCRTVSASPLGKYR